MAWRIDENVVRGEIDNRTRGRVVGRIWLAGRAAPIELDLAGDAWRDVAGRRLVFVNPLPVPGELENFATRQTGVVGDCTASRKVRVPEIPRDQIGEYYAARKPFPWHWGNSLYLEWFSTPNGRVVIESASYTLTVDEEVAWEMTPQEEEAQQRGNAEALVNFIGRMGGAARAKASDEAPEEGEHEEDEDTDAPDRPLTEDEADKMLDESDRLADRINARVEKEGGEQLDRIIEEELERRRVERGERLQTPEEEARRAEWVDEMNRAAEEVLANPAPDHEAVMKRAHPLAERARELSFALRKETKKRRWIPPDAMHDHEHPVADLIGSILSASAKFAGALNGEEWPPAIDFCAMKIARLKRARSYLDHALLAAEFCSQREIVDADWIARTQREINALGRECDVLIGELRARLAGPAG